VCLNLPRSDRRQRVALESVKGLFIEASVVASRALDLEHLVIPELLREAGGPVQRGPKRKPSPWEAALSEMGMVRLSDMGLHFFFWGGG
jgi:hypothetical protein